MACCVNYSCAATAKHVLRERCHKKFRIGLRGICTFTQKRFPKVALASNCNFINQRKFNFLGNTLRRSDCEVFGLSHVVGRRKYGSMEVSEEEDERYPEGQPSWLQLQHISTRLGMTLPEYIHIRPDFTIYRNDVQFYDRIRKVTTEGLDDYIQELGRIKIFLNFRCAYARLEVLNTTPMVEDGTVRVRWRLRYVGSAEAILLFWVFRLWDHDTRDQRARLYDGYSVFFVDYDGLVYRHVLDKMEVGAT